MIDIIDTTFIVFVLLRSIIGMTCAAEVMQLAEKCGAGTTEVCGIKAIVVREH